MPRSTFPDPGRRRYPRARAVPSAGKHRQDSDALMICRGRPASAGKQMKSPARIGSSSAAVAACPQLRGRRTSPRYRSTRGRATHFSQAECGLRRSRAFRHRSALKLAPARPRSCRPCRTPRNRDWPDALPVFSCCARCPVRVPIIAAWPQPGRPADVLPARRHPELQVDTCINVQGCCL